MQLGKVVYKISFGEFTFKIIPTVPYYLICNNFLQLWYIQSHLVDYL